MREDEQAEHDEQSDLRGEGEPLVEGDELTAIARRRTADCEPDKIDGKEAAAANRVRGAECERGGCEGSDRNECADSGRKSSEDPCGCRAQADSDDQAEPDLSDDERDHVLDAVARGVLDPRDQSEGQCDRHRVVTARLGLQRAGKPPVGSYVNWAVTWRVHMRLGCRGSR